MRELRRRGYWRGVIEFELIIILVISFKRIVSDWDYESFWGCSRLSTSDNAVHSVRWRSSVFSHSLRGAILVNYVIRWKRPQWAVRASAVPDA